jgi:hypothetical protein
VHCNTLWIGPVLGALERACMRSVLRHGHTLSIYCYRPPDGIPPGIEMRDAGEIVPEELVIRHRSGSVSLFSNRFRYELQRQGRGTWIDTDAYLVAPLPDREYVFGAQDDGCLGVAVLRVPVHAPGLDSLLGIVEERVVPAWLRPRDRIRAHWRLQRSGRTQLAEMPWGTAGPHAFTHVARRHGLDRWALEPEVLYPVHWRDAAWIRDPRIQVESVTTERTVSVHLWNEMIKEYKDQPAEPGSFLARIQAEGAL